MSRVSSNNEKNAEDTVPDSKESDRYATLSPKSEMRQLCGELAECCGVVVLVVRMQRVKFVSAGINNATHEPGTHQRELTQ